MVQPQMITACSADGFIFDWEINPNNVSKEIGDDEGKELKFGELVSRIREENKNEINCMDFSPEGDSFATAGKDHVIRIYDDETKKVTSRLQGYINKNCGHSNRVFCLKYNPHDPNMLISGAWDNLVLIWDIREQLPVSHILGPNISGESLDISGNKLLIGSWAESDKLEIVDLRTLEVTSKLEWPYKKHIHKHPP